MGTVAFIGLGLDSDKGLSLEGLEQAQRADSVFAEFYTNLMPNLQLDRLEKVLGQPVTILNRAELEDENGSRIADAAQQGNVAFLVPGDPMIATTHVSLRLGLARKGISSRLIHASSIATAICGATGLQSYKFGKSTTIPNYDSVPPSVLDTISQNRDRGLHTTVLLDTVQVNGLTLTIPVALLRLTKASPSFDEYLAVGAARLGSRDEQVRAAKVATLKRLDFGMQPHALVFPGQLHFMEVETLRTFCKARDEDLA